MKKELKRSATDSMIFGVCGGIAEYLGVDSNVVRLIWVGVSLFAGTGILLYIIAAFIMPKADPQDKDLKDVIHSDSPKAEKQGASASDAARSKTAQPEEKDLKDVIHPEK